MRPLVGLPLDEALAICQTAGILLQVCELQPPRELAGAVRRVVRACPADEGMEVVVATFAGPTEDA